MILICLLICMSTFTVLGFTGVTRIASRSSSLFMTVKKSYSPFKKATPPSATVSSPAAAAPTSVPEVKATTIKAYAKSKPKAKAKAKSKAKAKASPAKSSPKKKAKAKAKAKPIPVDATTSVVAAKTTSKPEVKADVALLFDCDGVIVETEELHRVAYNKAFEAFGLELPSSGKKVVWDVAYYDILQNTIGGGKPKMNYYFNNDAKEWPRGTTPARPVPSTDEEKIKLVDELQDRKTECYVEIVKNLATARPGVLELMDEAIADPTVKVGICSAATRGGFNKILDSVVGQERASKLDVIIAGDDVDKKKPDPMIYNVAQERIGIPKENCLVIEDSVVGLKAAKGADMKCIITYTDSTATEDFYGLGAIAKVSNLGGVKLSALMDPLRKKDEILKGVKDPIDASKPKEVGIKGWTPHFMIVPPV